MRITDLLQPQCIALGVPCADKEAAIQTMAGLLEHAGLVTDSEAFLAQVFEREAQGPTGVGAGIAIPHGKSSAVPAPALAVLTLPTGVDWPGSNGPVQMAFLIAAPKNADALHVQVLARLAMLLMDPAFCARLRQAATPQDFLALIATREEAEDVRETARRRTAEKNCPILAVTACPAGIAHTYLAAQALEQAAEKRGLAIKVETNGAAGVENPLSAADIAAAQCIILAADKLVPTARFAGKPVLQVSVTTAIRSPEALLAQAQSGTVPKFEAAQSAATQEDALLLRQAKQEAHRDKLSTHLHHMYTHLMSGVSYMLPFVTGGGVMMALSLFLQRLGAPSGLSHVLQGLGDAAFSMMYPMLAGFLAVSMAGWPAFVPGAVGGFLAESGMTVGAQIGWTSSGFWGALVAGFAAGTCQRLLVRLGRKFPKGLDQAKITLVYPGFGLFCVGLLMVFFVNPPLGHFNQMLYQALATLRGGSRLVLCGVLGALMATDYGGPINKAAYLTGTVALVNEQLDIMAAVMLGGMTPPLGVALASLLFPKKFTKTGRQTAAQNWLLGISFVTEGALPFALKDPLHVISACMVGSGTAGIVAELLGCDCPAPHGGLFLLPVMRNPIGFLVALAIGTVVTALLLGAFKKDEKQNEL